MNTQIAEYKPIAAVLADLSGKYKGVLYDVSTSEGMRAAKEGKKEIAQYRIALEKARVNLKEESLKRGRLIDSEAKPIAAALAALEDPIEEQIKADERKKEAERLRLAQAEVDRLAAEEKARKDAEEAKFAAERAEIIRQRQEMDRLQREAAAKIEADQREARMKIEEEARQERLARQAREEVERVKRQEEEARIKAEREKVEAERKAVEDAARKVREAEEAKAREIQRKKDESLGARQMLSTFVQKYGALPEFESIAGIIETFLKGKK